MTIFAAVAGLILGYYLIRFFGFIVSDLWKDRRFETKNEYALHSRENNNEVKFITKGRDYR